MKNLLQSILVIAGVILLEVFADQIPPLVRLSRSLEEQPQPYLTVAIIMIAGGGLLFMGSLFAYFRRGRWLKKVRKTSLATNADWSARQDLSFHEIKDAYRSGLWFHDSGWMLFTFVVLGAFIVSIGLISLFVVIGTPGIKLLMVGLFVYAVARTAWAFVKA